MTNRPDTDAGLRVLVVSRQAFFRAGVRLALAELADTEVAYMAEPTPELAAYVEDVMPDVMLIDLDGQADELLSLARKVRLRSPSVGIIMLSSNTSDGQLFVAMKAQASAYLDKNVEADALIETIHRVARGEHPINEFITSRPQLAERVLKQFQEFMTRQEMRELISPLTPRETVILEWMARGLPNKQIAYESGTSEQTIKNHVTSILRKLDANARTEAVVKALKQGYISLDGIQSQELCFSTPNGVPSAMGGR
jgi:DNA-binding NarL/FixJ family response regulator